MKLQQAYRARPMLWLPAVMFAGAMVLSPDLRTGGAANTAWAGQARLATHWVRGHNSAMRLIAGRLTEARADSPAANPLVGNPPAGPPLAGLYAGASLVIGDGWKTYWRHPGDDAGVPPFFDFTGSQNLSHAEVLYPAPHRFRTPGGDSIGYKHAVTFPIRLTAKDAAKPIMLKLKMDYGICREICIPASSNLTLDIPPVSALSVNDGDLAAALAQVPRGAEQRQPGDPVLKAGRAELSGARPRLVFDIDFQGALAGADLFVEGPDGAYVPQPQRHLSGAGGGKAIKYVVDLTKGADVKELTGKALRLTLVSDAGQSQATWIMK